MLFHFTLQTIFAMANITNSSFLENINKMHSHICSKVLIEIFKMECIYIRIYNITTVTKCVHMLIIIKTIKLL